jgi:hypothetical protein
MNMYVPVRILIFEVHNNNTNTTTKTSTVYGAAYQNAAPYINPPFRSSNEPEQETLLPVVK